MLNRTLLDRVSIVLVNTKTPANIGATARCMMNTGLSRLVLVNPPHDDKGYASRLAAGADHILQRAQVFTSLAEAVSAQSLVIGASRRKGKHRKNILLPRDMAMSVVPLLTQNDVAIVFGNEITGLEICDISLCHELVKIPSAESFPSLNLSHAVMIIAYELFVTADVPLDPLIRKLARTEDLEFYYARLRDTLQAMGFFNGQDPNRIMYSLRQIFGRSRLESRDVQILQGILSTFIRMLKNDI